MMNGFKWAIKTTGLAVAASASLLVACGGDSTNPQDDFVSKLNSAVAGLGTSAGLASSSVIGLFDTAFLDSGTSRVDVKAALDRNANALAASPDLSLFPLANISGVTVSNCDSSNICTLTGTLTNTDADTTEVAFTTKVKNVNGAYYFFGDQLAS
jgi:hypothetical protein